jgi:decaprenylphospho-beta-D-erythro-pentofuranosid-2-ulose 2-reductase
MIVADDLRSRGAGQVETHVFDALETERLPLFVTDLFKDGRRFDYILVAHGFLSEQTACEQDLALTKKTIEVNAMSVILLLAAMLPFLQQQRGGSLAVISSVAGDRGRASMYTYGAAKAALNVFLQGFRARLAPQGVAVLTLKPGYIDTPMTAHVPKGLLFTSSERAGRIIHRLLVRGRSGTFYIPWFWRVILTILRCIPEPLFIRLNI